jgi:hypothetical protein
MPDSKKSCLPAFACLTKDEVDLWPSGEGLSYSQATAEGRERAEQLLEIMRRMDSPALLGHVLHAMIARGQQSGVEVGFASVLALELMQLPVTQFVEVPAEPQFPVSRKLGCLRMVG